MLAAPTQTSSVRPPRSGGVTVGRAAAVAIVLAGLLGGAGAVADQKDPRLDPLFAQLQSADSGETAELIEAQIWMLWSDSGDAKVDQLMGEGVAGLQGNDFDKALGAFDQVVSLAPEFAEGWNKRATTLFLMGRFADSIKDIDRVLALEPRHFGALSGLGLCRSQMNDDQAAVDAFERALAVDPNLSGAKRNIEELKQRIARHSI